MLEILSSRAVGFAPAPSPACANAGPPVETDGARRRPSRTAWMRAAQRTLLSLAVLRAGIPCWSAESGDPLPRSVLVLFQSIPHTKFFSEFFVAFQATLRAGADTPITVYSEKLEYSHFSGPEF